jgi:hypothetical protein
MKVTIDSGIAVDVLRRITVGLRPFGLILESIWSRHPKFHLIEVMKIV